MEGNEDGNFLPNTSTDRAMVVVTLFRLSGDTGTYNQASQFTDVPSNAYYYNAVGWAIANGITSGANASEFKPTRIITWSEFFTFFYRYADYMGLPTTATESITGAPDYDDVGSWARTPISWAYTYGMLLRSTPYAYIYPNANLDRKTQALFIARFRRNVEGIVWNRDRFEFLNTKANFRSSVNHIGANSRRLITDTDWYRLTGLANGDREILNELQAARRKQWSGSCLGISLATILHAQGKINFTGNTTNNCEDLYSIPKLYSLSNTKHRVYSDTYYTTPTNVTDVESKINMYQLSQYVPSLAVWTDSIVPYEQLQNLLDGHDYGGIGLFCYSFDDSSKCGGESVNPAHAVVTYGKLISTSYGFKVKIYDNRYSSSDCWVEVNTSNWSGTVVVKNADNLVERERIINCRYYNNFELYNTTIDFDGPANANHLNRSTRAEDTEKELLGENLIQASSKVTVDGEDVSLDGKTILYVDCFKGFEIENGTGQKLRFSEGKISGTMESYGINLIPQGEDYPCTYAFIVDDSTSFTCSNLSDSAKILSFSAYGESLSSDLKGDSIEAIGYRIISIDSAGRIVSEE